MNVSLWVWLTTIVGLLGLVTLDLFIVDREPHEVTVLEAAKWVIFYVTCAIGFGALLWIFAGGRYAGEFFSGYLTEYSLSVDNLFVFLAIIMAFHVPPIHQHRALLVGIVIALVLRGTLITVGGMLINEFAWIFYLFSAFLFWTALYTAMHVWRSAGDGPAEYHENAILRMLRRVVPVSESYHGARSFIRVNNRLMITPMLVVMIALGTTDLMFALDSIPAVFGLTQESFLVFAVNAFALLGLRQLYFLVDGLLRKLVYLPFGLVFLLVFIAVKLVFVALDKDANPFESGNQIVRVPVLSEWFSNAAFSVGFIAVVLTVTVIASLCKARKQR